MTASISYLGDLRCSATHLQSGTAIETDAPTDNRGKGEKFSPTDTLCVALGTCIITTMAIKARDMNIDLKGTNIDITKHMQPNPRRVAQVDVTLKLPVQPGEQERSLLESIGNNCPVAKSIHPDMKLNIHYLWDHDHDLND
jgi:Predicted redox protein, regulator of disulfide bond formation